MWWLWWTWWRTWLIIIVIIRGVRRRRAAAVLARWQTKWRNARVKVYVCLIYLECLKLIGI